MAGTTTSLCLFLLLNQLQFCPTDADQVLTTMQMTTYEIDLGGSSPSTMESSHTSTEHIDFPDTDTNGTRADCLIDTEMGLIAIGSAGGLIVCLLVAVMVLACQVCHLQNRVYAPRISRSNMNLVSSASYWDTDQPDAGGVVGPCDTSVILEEVTSDNKTEQERQAKTEEVKEEARTGFEEGATAMDFHPEEKASQMPSSRDYCLEVSRDLEDMPLVV
ncbi:uncharacterized protein LOC131462081 [Solea solea]|uniref:uncharacterized protein LOC122774025 n=1 Tax=Solea senegalensis TaxID=28829 RepID=UPI001CD85ED2|nr:uncharacterized protein LOC122774025 [Solea senegalensis]XP_058488979.1 uncharacterized protein LOC131462081 [Solea solea]XP_058488980.1 uncharacterized protein LOC131462081 [Solea solea]XP_058488981.1 uncharacterized protein LOC131462081 [Solea solea]XP_058488982.1 uncharacterized protein LOC131462081 [Solea solea]